MSANPSLFPLADFDPESELVTPQEWQRITKFDPRGAAIADKHYNRRKVGSPQWMPPGETLNFLTGDGRALWGWWRPHPDSGIKAMNNLDGWTCTIFRNVGDVKSSLLILRAETALRDSDRGCGPDGMLTYVWDKRVASANPGYCFKMAGWKPIGRSADDKKTLLQKPFELAGIEPEPRTCFGPDGKGCFIPHDCDGKCACAPWMQEVPVARFERGTGCGPYDAPSDPPWHTPDVLNDEGLDRETL
jgi:hypothetical protein